ncbi:YolD-like family protein [Paenibacillus farraposensis]|uniref:YolD-like family protein n=1 Tax=Paenibacillus farraposensis TaxID=2807095 RepID=A0ABW4DLX7_9BACL|nr:YolD-like family protein [Paenibacillus farraposensis]MCC3378514.1 YolD-like family protein [Paenibacillus farraposensis]
MDEDQLQNTNDVVALSLEENKIVEVIYYDHRCYKSLSGWVKRCDLFSGFLVLEHTELGQTHIFLENIKDIQFV